ncbi:MAG: hypothetical protein Q4P13_10375 [Psychrobacter sp.]|nr:hypothetical protein [Psychrobacter sp.]
MNNENNNRLLTPLESLQISWCLHLRDFRAWMQPTTLGLREWKRRRSDAAIIACEGRMIDDAEAMLKALEARDTAGITGDTTNSGTSVDLPVMLTAISPIESPPEWDQLIPQPYWAMGVVPHDPLQRVIEYRTAAAAYRCQVAFFSPDPHATSSVSKQFINYFRFEVKRNFDVWFEIGYAGSEIIRDNWNFRALENSIYPDKADVGATNIKVAVLDLTIIGLEPTVVGLGAEWDDITDTGEPDGSTPPGIPTLPGHRLPPEALGKFVIEADVIDAIEDYKNRVSIDPATKVITETRMKGGL